MILFLFGQLNLKVYLCAKQQTNMATREQIESLKIDENVFELAEDTELEYLVHFAAPFIASASSDAVIAPGRMPLEPLCQIPSLSACRLMLPESAA